MLAEVKITRKIRYILTGIILYGQPSQHRVRTPVELIGRNHYGKCGTRTEFRVQVQAREFEE